MFQVIPKPTGCTKEQLQWAYIQFYHMPLAELSWHYQWCVRMMEFLIQSGRTNLDDQLRNLRMFRDMTSKAINSKADVI